MGRGAIWVPINPDVCWWLQSSLFTTQEILFWQAAATSQNDVPKIWDFWPLIGWRSLTRQVSEFWGFPVLRCWGFFLPRGGMFRRFVPISQSSIRTHFSPHIRHFSGGEGGKTILSISSIPSIGMSLRSYETPLVVRMSMLFRIPSPASCSPSNSLQRLGKQTHQSLCQPCPILVHSARGGPFNHRFFFSG